MYFHFRPDLTEALVESIGLLHKGKQGVLDLFRGCKVPSSLMKAEADQVARDKDSISKFVIARNILRKMNEQGNADDWVSRRREVARRIAEWQDFSTCWDRDELKARGAVAKVREIINVYDSFTRMKQAKEDEAMKHRKQQDERRGAEQKRSQEFEAIKQEFYGLFGPSVDPQKRGKALEGVLNRFFKHGGIGIREAFTVTCDENGKPLEQIDGVIEIDRRFYLVEMKWEQDKTDVPRMGQHLNRVFMRCRSGDIRGMYISYAGYTESAIITARDAKPAGAFVFLCTVFQLFQLMESKGDLLEFCRRRITAADVDKNHYLND